MSAYRCLVLAALLAACGGGNDKPAEDATNANPNAGPCPPSMEKEGGECVPKSGSSSGSESSTSTDTPQTAKVPYDKDNVEMVLKRAALQVKSNCGAATDDTGKPSGPWGQTKVTVTLGRNGHVRDVTIPDPYDGKPTGKCALLAFRGLIFPPYAAPADVSVEWDVDIEKPSK